MSAAGLKRVFGQGVLVNILNPKVAIFFLAFLPQFIDPSSPNPAFQSLILGVLMVVIGLISDSVYAIAGGSIGDRLRWNPRFARRTRIGAGIAYLGLAGVAAFTGTKS